MGNLTVLDKLVFSFPWNLHYNRRFSSTGSFFKLDAVLDTHVTDNRVFSQLSYYNYVNVKLFTNFVEMAMLNKTFIIDELEDVNLFRVFIPTDRRFLRNILTWLIEYEHAGELAIYLLKNGGLFVSPGDAKSAADSIIKRFENNDNVVNNSFPVYGEDNDYNKVVHQIFDNLGVIDYRKVSSNFHDLVMYCELPSLIMLIDKFINESDNRITFDQWLKQLVHKDYNFEGMTLWNSIFYDYSMSDTTNIPISLFSPGKTGFYPDKGDIKSHIGKSPFYMFWNNAEMKATGKIVNKEFLKFTKDNFTSLSKNMNKVSSSPFEFNSRASKNVSSIIYIQQLKMYLEEAKSNNMSNIITEQEIIESFPNFRRKLSKRLIIMEEENNVTTEELNDLKIVARRILNVSHSSIFYQSMTIVLNHMNFNNVNDVELYDFIVLVALMKNPSSFLARSTSDHAVKIVNNGFDTCGDLRKITHLLNSLAQMNYKPRVGINMWKTFLEDTKNISFYDDKISIQLAMSATVNKPNETTTALKELKHLNLLL